MAPPDLTTLDAVKGWLGLTDPSLTSDDTLLAALITAASGFARTYCSRDFSQTDYDESYDGLGGRKLPLRHTPIIAVTSLTINGQPIPPGSVPGVPGWLNTPTMIVLNGYVFRRGMLNVQVAYTAGYAEIPAELAQACVEMVGFRYREMGRIGMSSKSMGGETTSYQVKDVPISARTMLDQYKTVATS